MENMDSEKESSRAWATKFLRARKKCSYEAPITNLKRLNRTRKKTRQKRRNMSPETKRKNLEKARKKYAEKHPIVISLQSSEKSKTRKRKGKKKMVSIGVNTSWDGETSASLAGEGGQNSASCDNLGGKTAVPTCIIKEEVDLGVIKIKEEVDFGETKIKEELDHEHMVEDRNCVDEISSSLAAKEGQSHATSESVGRNIIVPTCIVKEEIDLGEIKIKQELDYEKMLENKDCESVSHNDNKTEVSEEAIIIDVEIKEEIFECDECNKKFTELRGLETHQFINKRLFKCDICEKSYCNNSDLHEHKKEHTEEVQKEVCESCINLTEKPNTGDYYACTMCKKYLFHLTCLNNHIRCIHEEKKPFMCKVCEKSFTNSSYIWTHQKLHSEKPHTCSECLMGFAKLKQLQIHETIHPTKKKYECAHCKKQFSIIWNLRKHLIIHGDRYVIV